MRTLPEKLLEFQKITKHIRTALNGNLPIVMKLASNIRKEVEASNPNISPQELTKRTIKLFDDNKAKYTSEYNKLLNYQKIDNLITLRQYTLNNQSIVKTKMNIALVGLPSSGKSSIINSLIGKRLAQSGVSRTTTEAKLYENLISDDNIDFNIYDLPGIADIEDRNNNFDSLVFETIKKCDLVIWISDIIKAFMTNHEMNEYIKIKKYIEDIAINEGIPIQLFIMLSKMDKNIDDIIDDTNNKSGYESDDTYELTGPEDTTVLNIYNNVKTLFNTNDIICFNAYGRSYHHSNSSSILTKFVKPYNPNNINTSFNIKKYYDKIPIVHDCAKIKNLIEFKFINGINRDVIDYKYLSQQFMDTINILKLDQTKIQIINFLLYDGDKLFKPLGINITYNPIILNTLCLDIKINIKKYIQNIKITTDNQIFRTITIGQDLSLNDKLLLYVHDNCKTIDLPNNKKFVKKVIDRLDHFREGLYFKIHNNNDHFCMSGSSQGPKLYSTKFLNEVKKIRREIFGEIEDDIDITMIPIAYPSYGLFWKPV